jgi:hypothetical protein
LGAYLGEDVVIRLLPGTSLAASRVASASSEIPEGRTFSPDLQSWVAGRYAVAESFRARPPLRQAQKSSLTAFAKAFGDEGALKRVLAAVEQVRAVKDIRDRTGILWSAIAPKDASFRAISKAWTLRSVHLRQWVNETYPRQRDETITAGIFVSLNLFYETGVDVAEAAWRVVKGDCAFDFAYNGTTPAQGFPWKETAPLMSAVAALEGARPTAGSAEALLLKAARAFARAPVRYAGDAHLAAAGTIASHDPRLAYVQAANAAMFHARAGKGAFKEAIQCAHSLAMQHGWTDLATVLGWAAGTSTT